MPTARGYNISNKQSDISSVAQVGDTVGHFACFGNLVRARGYHHVKQLTCRRSG